MIVTINDLKEQYKDYKDIYGKIKRDVESNILFPVVKGIYETNEHTSGHLLSAYIYGPSYLSFEYALSYHNLIPEKVVNYTNATFNKNKRKSYHNKFGTYLYRNVPNEAYPYFVKAFTNETYSYFIASPEKALCDMLYILPPTRSMKEFRELLFLDLRINEVAFKELNLDDILFLNEKYKSTNVRRLVKLIESEYLLWLY